MITCARGLRLAGSFLIAVPAPSVVLPRMSDGELVELALRFPAADAMVEAELARRYPDTAEDGLPEPVDLDEWAAELEDEIAADLADRAPWEHLWNTRTVALEAVRAEHAEAVRMTEDEAERVTAMYPTELAEYFEAHPIPTLAEYLRRYGLAAELKPSQRAARKVYVTRTHADAKRAQVRARARSLANRTGDRRDALRGSK